MVKMARKVNGFPRQHRLGGRGVFAAIYARGFRQSAGPLLVYCVPNTNPFNRWGLSAGRRIGIAVRRNRLKRLIRESIRLLKRELAGGYDVVIVIRPHEPLTVGQYRLRLKTAMTQAHQHWSKGGPKIP
jgi:ribonuclease P protein component